MYDSQNIKYTYSHLNPSFFTSLLSLMILILLSSYLPYFTGRVGAVMTIGLNEVVGSKCIYLSAMKNMNLF